MKCNWCKGKGFIICDVCGGSGEEFTVDEFGEHHEQCSYCENGYQGCPQCNGEGDDGNTENTECGLV